ncbi:hypothetical protein TSUD_239440 [Trifolium subterraneum]|uniref:Insecticidal crystal toxin domain-containing protein n=1 Tax=Trifolium subterraneum TaxID=3900 RepID=A0A2Z6MVW9_TRISU|nr:hypothetical protein TSUD_239440 [Trifolium subterraneum]
MYAARLLSMYRRNPSALSDPPPSGPNSGYLVILDEEAQTYCCFGSCEDDEITDFPFPQNKNLTMISSLGDSIIENSYVSSGIESTIVFESLLCHKKDGKESRPFNDYQQIQIIKRSSFHAKSIASDGIPPGLLRDKGGWRVYASTPYNYHLSQALGSNDSLRSKLPNFDFPISNDRSESVIVGKWYCPFMFVKEGMKLKEQMNMTVFYELTLEQRWEKIFTKENENNGENNVLVDVVIQTEVAKVVGKDAIWDENRLVDDVLWFKSIEDVGEETSVGLRMEVVKAMKWEQERFGWVAGNGRQVRVTKVEEFDGTNKWKKFGCYVLVESFVLKRMNRRLVLTYDYKHSHQIRSKWD